VASIVCGVHTVHGGPPFMIAVGFAFTVSRTHYSNLCIILVLDVFDEDNGECTPVLHCHSMSDTERSRWPRGLRRESAAARLLGLPEAWMFVCCESWALSGRGLCDGSFARPEETYRV